MKPHYSIMHHTIPPLLMVVAAASHVDAVGYGYGGGEWSYVLQYTSYVVLVIVVYP